MKKLISLLMVMAMLLSVVAVPAFAQERPDARLTYLDENGIMVGDEYGNLRLEANISRAEVSKVISVACGIEGAEGVTFPDVEDSHWAKGYIASMKQSGIINGYPDGTFKPANDVTYAEFIKMLVEALGYGSEALAKGGFPVGHIAAATSLGILDRVNFVQDAPAVRNDVATILYNAREIQVLPKQNLFVMGDSLADTFKDEGYYPLQGWGTFLGDYFKDSLTVHNHARNGWTTKRYLEVGFNSKYPDQTYWEVIRDQIKPGDWVLIGLGINDCSLTNGGRTTEEEYEKNLTLFTEETRARGGNMMFITQTIKAGTHNSEEGWEFIIPSDGIPMDANVPMQQRWVRRTQVLTAIGEKLDVPVLQFNRFLYDHYEACYQEYMAAHPEATVAEGRDYVRYRFHLYTENLNDEISNGGWGLNVPETKVDDQDHTNVRGGKEFASIISNLISETDTALADYVLEKEELPEKTLFIMGDSLADLFPNKNYPLQGWGNYISDNVKNQLTVKNCAKNGWTTKSYLTEGRNEAYPDQKYWDVIKADFKEGDWLLIGLGINDCSLSNKFRTTEEEYKANLTLFTEEARAAGVNVMFITQTIKGGDDGSEAGWEYIAPSDGIPMDENVPMEKRWVRRAQVLTEIGEELNVPTIQFGKFLSEYYEEMYQEYMAANPEATVAEGRNHVRYHFHIYNKNINAPKEEGGWGLNLPDRADDSTHTNIKGAREYAAIITYLISQTDTGLKPYMSSLLRTFQ